MSDQKSLAQRWEDFRPSKSLWVWSCAGSIAATMVVGFTVGGWVTGGTAQEMAENAVEETRAELVASVCVERFVDSTQFADQLASLKEADSWDRDGMIVDGGWVTLANMDEPVDDAADLCAERLVAMEVSDKEQMAVTPAVDTMTPAAPAVDEKAVSNG